MPDDSYTLEPRDDPPAPMGYADFAALLERIEASKRILACASDVYERVREQIESSGLGAYFRVIEQPLLDDGMVLSIDPGMLELPPAEAVIDPEAFKPKHRCVNCMRETYMPGYCSFCAEIAKAFPPRLNLGSIITGI